MRRVFLAATTLLLAGCASLPAPPAAPVSVELLALNDFHGSLEPPGGANGRIGDTPAGGAEYLAAHLQAALKANPKALVVAAGDMINASPLLSSLFHDEPTIESLSVMGLTVSAVGNHEFDEGVDELLRMQNGGCGGADPGGKCRAGAFKGAGFRYLAANVVRKADPGRPILPPYEVRTIDGVKIGFIGETLKGTPEVVTASAVEGLAFLDEAETANRYAAELKAQGVSAIVLLLHEGGFQAQGSGGDYNGCTGLNGSIVPILARLSPDIGVVVSAHTHVPYNCRIGGRVVTSNAAFGRMFTRIKLTVDPSAKRLVAAEATNVIAARDVAKDAAQTALIDRYRAMASSITGRVVGQAGADIVRAENAAGESPLGDVIADAQLAATRAPDRGGAVVAFMNSGGIRADLAAGEITYGEVFDVQPFGNVLTVVTLTGAQIEQVLERQFDNPSAGQTDILQVSEGFTYAYRQNAPAGQHVDPASIRLNGQVVDPNGRYRAAMTNYLADGGASYSMFKDAGERWVGEPDLDALVAWLGARSPVAPGAQNRIVRLD